MKLVTLSIEETLRYNRKMIIEIPDDMSEEKLNSVLTKIERQTDAAVDIPYILKDFGINTVDYPDEDMSSPWDTEIEITDFDIEE